MVLDLNNSSTTHTAVTPPESEATGLDDDDRFPTAQKHSSTPRTFLIKAVTSSQMITLRDGRIVLAQSDGRGSHWKCIEAGGWLGFRNAVSGAFLGRDNCLVLCCWARWHKGWDQFRVREKRERMGSLLLMDPWWSLRHIGLKVENGIEKLVVNENWEADELA